MTYQTMSIILPRVRSAWIQFRVIKTTRQTFPHVVSYPEVVRHIVKEDGLIGLFGRGLKTRLIANGMQGLLFSVLYRHFMELQERRRRGD